MSHWKKFKEGKQFTPHARGSTESSEKLTLRLRVYPACAGIDRLWHTNPRMQIRLPRMRGDRPLFFTWRVLLGRFTPHARGSTALIDFGF